MNNTADTALARASDPSESHAAAARVSASALCELVLEALRNRGPMTTHEIASYSGVSLVSISPRMKPLSVAGLVQRTGERRNGSAVWNITTQEKSL